MPLHLQAAAFLAQRAHDGAVPDHQISVTAARARADVPPPGPVEPVGDVRDLRLPAPGREVPVRIYIPAATPAGLVLYLHGGGHVTGTVASYDGLTRRLANRVPAVVVAVDYRRAPEHRCPAPVEDAEIAYRWMLEHADELVPGSPVRVAVAGDSAGGNIVAVLVRRLRDAGFALPVLQVLVYPTLDALAYRSRSFPSHTERASGCGLLYEDGLWYWDHYLGPDGDPAHPDASPLRAASLAGLPPAYVLTVEYDVLRDEGRAYVEALRAAGVRTEHRHWDGHLHGFLGDPSTFDDAEPALDEIAVALRQQFTTP